MRTVTVVVLPGDGIGPEVVREARRLVDAVAGTDGLEVVWEEHPVGGASIDLDGTALTEEVLERCRSADAVLLGAVGGPKWDTTDPDRPRPEQGLLGLRAGLELFANLRPVRPWPALYDASPLRRERIEGTDLLVVRELTGGIYFGERGRSPDGAFDTCAYSRPEGRRGGRGGPPGAAGGWPPRWTRPPSASPPASGARRSSRPPPAIPSSRSSTCSWTTRRCSSSAGRPRST